MAPHYLNHFFNPQSVAIIGATEREGSVGHRLMINMIEAGFTGKLYPINPKREQLMGIPCFASMAAIPDGVELAVIATPARTVPELVRQCGEKGVQSIVIISAGFAELGEPGLRLQSEVLDHARRYNIRIIGPNCLGIIRPNGNLNATFGYGKVADGHLALVSQSGAVCTAILDWAQSQDIGFSTVVSMGGAADIDFGEVLDYLATDPHTHSILLYVEGIHDARRFLSGLKAAARLKPVILIKSGRYEAGSKAAVSHTGSMVGGDDVFDAAIERAGVVRAYSIAQLFSAARILTNRYSLKQDRLAIITNAGGPGVMSTDRAEDVGVPLAQLSESTIARLNKVLPEHWSHANPIDILGDATPERYRLALDICLEDEQIDGALVILTPQAMTNPTEVAQCMIDVCAQTHKPVLASWTGGARVQEGRDLLNNAHIAQFSTPEVGVDAFSFLAKYNRNQKLVKQIPLPREEMKPADIDGARMIIERVLAEDREMLTTQESKAILSAFRIPVTQTIKVLDAKDAIIAAETVGFPVVLKINMAEFSHKSDIGGVKLNLTSAQQVADAFQDMANDIRRVQPDIASIVMSIEPMYQSPNKRELMIGVVRDPVFGPAISFGLGGTMVEIIRDKAIALPPLNDYMVEHMISKTKAARYLEPFRQMQGSNKDALIDTLLRVSEMISELPEIIELDINPLIVDDRGAIAVDARIRAQSCMQLVPYSHMAIHPYPHDLAHRFTLPSNEQILIRPIKPEDAKLEKEFFGSLSDRSRYFRFKQGLHELTPEMVVRFTQIDYDREMAFVAVSCDDSKPLLEMGVGRYVLNPDGKSADFAIVIADQYQGMGIGAHLMKTLMQTAKSKGVVRFEGEVLAENQAMLSMVKKLGFSISENLQNSTIVHVSKSFQ
ncbi:MAG: bifunctional acetate--CoA ligase family protein/GNAT family N-acetyltransferase [Zetaproteobacteria bacterium]|nr:bifunctional acetate--CoA ligase family protein/GNAT family N-acetyltransferase [Zetaproteobacteria bacterium]